MAHPLRWSARQETWYRLPRKIPQSIQISWPSSASNHWF